MPPIVTISSNCAAYETCTDGTLVNIEYLFKSSESVKSMSLDVVVCVKNRAHVLEQTLQQILREVPVRELIVVYGSSSNGTKGIAEKYADKVFWDEDKGLGAARNLGVRKASSELVAMIDSDVILTKDWYKRLVKHFEDPKVAAVTGTIIFGYGFLPVQRLYEYWRTRSQVWGYFTSNCMFKRGLILEVGNFDETIRGAGEDADLYRRVIAAGYKWAWDRDVVVYHPMSLLEYLDHLRWWAQSVPLMQELAVQVRTYSLFRVYCRLVGSILDRAREGVRLSLIVHPSMLFYMPMFEAVMVRAKLEGIKKRQEDSHLQLTEDA
jgi:glycosyltransferase involved in cell wall biosynthesis